MKKYLIAIVLAVLPLSGCGDASNPTRLNNFTPLTSIEITPLAPQIANLTSTQLRAIGNFSGLFTRDITADVIWTSDNEPVATVSNNAGTFGRATGVSPGVAGISATLGDLSGSFSLTVSNATLSSLTLTPLLPTTPKGLTSQFQASGTFSDATTQDLTLDVNWSSSDPLVATISNLVGSEGLASALDVGSSTITATFGATTASTEMRVSAALLNSMTISPAAPSILSLSSGQMTATGTFSDGTSLEITDQVTWTSSQPVFATISDTAGSKGQVTTLLNGFTTITASLDGVSANTGLSVTGGNLTALSILPTESTYIHLDPVLALQLSATGTFPNGARDISSLVTWSSSLTSVATIDSQGVVTTVGPGTTEIQAVYGSGTTSEKTGIKTLTVTTATFTAGTLTISPAIIPATAPAASIAVGTSQPFTASGEFSDRSTRDLTAAVDWTSSNTAVATISNDPDIEGVASGVAAGTTTVSADFRGLDSDSSTLQVTAPTLVSVAIDNLPASLQPGQSLQLTATATYLNAPTQDISADVVWSSANPAVAIFPEGLTNGKLLGVNSGSVVITAAFDGKTDTVTVVVP